MRLFHTIHDVIEVAQQHAPTRACQRWMDEQGSVLVWKVPSLPGWIVEVIGSDTSRSWKIGVRLDAEQQRIRISYPDMLPPDAVQVKGPRL